MEIVKKIINFDDFVNEDIYIAFLGDVHEGNSLHDRKAFLRAINYIEEMIKKHKHYYVIFMGDLLDSIVLTDKRFDPTEVAEEYKIKDLKDMPRKQADIFLHHIKNIPNDRIITALIGNHEEKYVRYNFFNVYDYLCTQKNISKLGYLGYVILILKFPSITRRITFFLLHGNCTSLGFNLEAYSLNNVIRQGRWIDADVIGQGHLHNLDSKIILREYVDNNLNLRCKPMLFFNSGCFLKKRDIGKKGYFEGAPVPASLIGFMEIKISMQRFRSLNKDRREFVFEDNKKIFL